MSEPHDAQRQLALQAQKQTRKFFVVELDFSLKTIAQFDELRTTMAYALRGGRSPENIRQWSEWWGAYLGEMLRAATGAAWVESAAESLEAGDTAKVATSRWELVRDERRVSPAALVRRWLEADALEKFAAIYDQALAALTE